MARVKLGARRQITIPTEIIKRLGITAGEELELVETGKAIILVSRKHIPKDQQWYQRLPQRLQRQFDKTLGLLLSNPHHPSLRMKKMEGQRDPEGIVGIGSS